MNCFICRHAPALLCEQCHNDLLAAAVAATIVRQLSQPPASQDIQLDPNRLELTPLPNQRTLDLRDPSKLIV